ncbi:phosphatidylinositol-binding clathrin assembly protein LAP-like [Muntiacus reevesi]|uniref:phosphatidylinositol-binding clathrin assembly protein LAP-like n=1 Tax=Muntiacus reevesi TaxID=9886 RepID=UPI003307A153
MPWSPEMPRLTQGPTPLNPLHSAPVPRLSSVISGAPPIAWVQAQSAGRKRRDQVPLPLSSWLAAGDALMGSSASKAARAATTNEPTEPEPKHLADLIQYINGTNRSVVHLADILSEKTGSSSWVVVFKALVTVHHLMVYGNERFIQHLASRSSLFTLHNFLDKSVVEGYTMSAFIRRYSKYLNEKSLAYRLMESDITKTKRGTDGVMRTMNTKELLNTLPVIQIQFDALLNFNANADELTNGIVHAAFMLLFKDSLRLFAAYNEGILNLLEKYFDMGKKQCRESLDIYIKFLERMTKLGRFLKVAEQAGIDKNNIPYLSQAPHSLLEALKQHLASLEDKHDILPPYGMQRALIPSIPNNPFVKNSASKVWFSGDMTLFYDYVSDNYLNFGESAANRSDVKWCQPSEMEMTSEMNWQLSNCTCISTIWDPVSIPSISYMVQNKHLSGAKKLERIVGPDRGPSPVVASRSRVCLNSRRDRVALKVILGEDCSGLAVESVPASSRIVSILQPAAPPTKPPESLFPGLGIGPSRRASLAPAALPRLSLTRAAN